MTQQDNSVSLLCSHLATYGFASFGQFSITADDAGGVAWQHLAGRPALLFGNAGRVMWGRFSDSPEYRDGKPNPMNRWTERTLGEAVAQFADTEFRNVEYLFPFGEPVWPFQRWAKRAMGVEASPLGLLIHSEYGLWFALRAAIVLPHADLPGDRQQPASAVQHPCDTCADKPCLHTCPVGAFSNTGFDAAGCRGHLASGDSPDCMGLGCAARNSCPVGEAWRYGSAQLQFHMTAFDG